MNRDVVFTPNAPAPGGAYSQAVRVGDLVFVSAIAPRNPETNELMFPNDISKQTDQVLKNIESILEAAGASLQTVVKIDAFIRDTNEFAAFDQAYRRWFKEAPPARTTLVVGGRNPEQRVMMDAVALAHSGSCSGDAARDEVRSK